MAVKYSFLYFQGCEIQLFKKYALYLINIFLYFIILYIIKKVNEKKTKILKMNSNGPIKGSWLSYQFLYLSPTVISMQDTLTSDPLKNRMYKSR